MTYKTNDEFYNDAIKKGLIPLEEYVYKNYDSFAKDKIKLKCSICRDEFKITPHAVAMKNGYGCRSCNSRKSHEQFVKELSEIDSNIEVIGQYVKTNVKIECRCRICGFEWKRIPNDLLRGFGCPKCNNNIYYTPEQFKNEFYKINNKIELLTDFVNHKTPILCKCKIDGYEWNAYPYDLMNNRAGCRKCNGNALYTQESFVDKLKSISPKILVTGKFINNKTPLSLKCLDCDYEWEARPDNLLNERCGCPQCNKTKYKLEEIVKCFLDNNKISYKRDVRFDDLRGVGGKPLSYDFRLIDFPYFIECQGQQHYEPVKLFGGEEQLKIQQEHDRRKRDYAINHNYKLLEIKRKDIKNIEEILKQELSC